MLHLTAIAEIIVILKITASLFHLCLLSHVTLRTVPQTLIASKGITALLHHNASCNHSTTTIKPARLTKTVEQVNIATPALQNASPGLPTMV